MKIVNTEEENLHTSERLEEFKKKQGLTLSVKSIFFEKPEGGSSN